jgi:hypothetical protein
MSPNDLDNIYTRLCTRMTEAGKEAAELFLARFALLAITQSLTADDAHRHIEDAFREIGAHVGKPDTAGSTS